MTDLEPVAHLKFSAIDTTPETTLADWLEFAKHEFALKQIASKLLQSDDEQLAESVRRGAPEEWLELATAFADLRKRYESAAEVCGSCCARLFIVLEREFGEVEKG